MKKQEFDKEYDIIPLPKEDWGAHEKDAKLQALFWKECIDYNWSRMSVRNKSTEEITVGVLGKPWNEQTDENSTVYHPDILDAPIIPKINFFESMVYSQYSMESAQDARKKAQLWANHPVIKQHVLDSPIYLRTLSVETALAITSETTRVLDIAREDGSSLRKRVMSAKQRLFSNKNHSMWDVYNETLEVFGEHKIQHPKSNACGLIFNALYAGLICDCVSTKNFSRIEYHSFQGGKHRIWGELGFRIPKI